MKSENDAKQKDGADFCVADPTLISSNMNGDPQCSHAEITVAMPNDSGLDVSMGSNTDDAAACHERKFSMVLGSVDAANQEMNFSMVSNSDVAAANQEMNFSMVSNTIDAATFLDSDTTNIQYGVPQFFSGHIDISEI